MLHVTWRIVLKIQKAVTIAMALFSSFSFYLLLLKHACSARFNLEDHAIVVFIEFNLIVLKEPYRRVGNVGNDDICRTTVKGAIPSKLIEHFS